MEYVRLIIDKQDNLHYMKREDLTKLIEYKRRVDSQDHLKKKKDFEEKIKKKIQEKEYCYWCNCEITDETGVKYLTNPISNKTMIKCLTC